MERGPVPGRVVAGRDRGEDGAQVVGTAVTSMSVASGAMVAYVEMPDRSALMAPSKHDSVGRYLR